MNYCLRTYPETEMTIGKSDEFLSQEDLALKDLTWDELMKTWDLWLKQSQITNEQDAALISHGVFDKDPTPSD